VTTTLQRPRTVTARIDTTPPPPRTVTAHPEGHVVTVARRTLAHIPNTRLTTSTWWLVVTETGERLLTHRPCISYAPVSVYLRGLMVSITARSIVDPADHPDIPREVRPDYTPGAQYCPVPFSHPAVQLR
jgi:hypothetical protein